MIAVLLSSNRWKQVDKKVKQTIKVILVSWLIVSIWFGEFLEENI